MVIKMLTNLSDSQIEAIEKLNKYKVGALFMEQGTGKTRTAVELANSTDCDFVLYIAPYRVINPEISTSVKDEVIKWGGFNAPARYEGIETISMSDRVFLEILADLRGYKKPFIIIDESIKIKNFEAKRTQRVLDLAKLSEYRLILNGTPITKDLLDLWAQMEFLSPKILNMPLNQFRNTFCKIKTITKFIKGKTHKSEFISGYANVDYLNSLIHNFVYQCDLKLDLEKNNHTIKYKVEDDSEYKRIKDFYLNEEKMFEFNNNIFMMMTQSMQKSYSLDKAKIEALEGILDKVDKRKTIIFCKYVASREFCEKYGCLTLSMQKSSLGLNLQDYNTIIYFDKVWDYYLVEQSKSRIYRQGQRDDCNFYHLTSNLGLDKLIDKNIEKKKGVAEYLKEVSIKELVKEL